MVYGVDDRFVSAVPARPGQCRHRGSGTTPCGQRAEPVAQPAPGTGLRRLMVGESVIEVLVDLGDCHGDWEVARAHLDDPFSFPLARFPIRAYLD